MKNFLITGFGRSGTGFLSNILDMSNAWTVKHEPRGAFDEEEYRKNNYIIHDNILKDFNKDYYGEVNSRMRFYIRRINVNKKGIILRNPKSIIKSIANRKSIEKTYQLIDEVNYYYRYFNFILKDSSILKIEFEKMTSDINYLYNIIDFLNINDIDISLIDINKKININKKENYNSFEDLHFSIKDKYNNLLWK